MVTYLVVKNGEGEARYPIKSSITHLGRALDNDVVVSDVRASRKHCQILYTRQGFKVVDLGSNNGTRVNEEKIKEHLLKPGDVIFIGATQITLMTGTTAAVPASNASPKTTATSIKAVAGTPSVPPDFEETEIARGQEAAIPAEHPGVGSETTQQAQVPAAIRKSTGATSRFKTSGLRNSMTSRVMMEAGKKRMNPWMKLGIVVGAFVVVGLAVYLILPAKVDVPQELLKIKTREEQAQKLVNSKKVENVEAGVKQFEELIKDYKLLTKKHEQIKLALDYIEPQLAAAQNKLKLEKEAPDAIEKIRTWIRENTTDSLSKAATEAAAAQSTYKETTHFKTLRDLAREIDDKIRNLTRVAEEYEGVEQEAKGLSRRKEFGKAIEKIKEFIQKIAGEKETESIKQVREKADRMIGVINDDARKEFNFQKSKAQGLMDEGKKDSALKLLKMLRDRLEGTSVQKAADDAIREFESK